MRDALRRLLLDTRGNIAVFFGLAVIPVVMIAGGGVDYARVTGVKSALQQSLDAGVLAAASGAQTSSAYLQNLVNANLASRKAGSVSATLTTATASSGAATYKGDASAAVSTSFLKIFGVTTVTVRAHSEAAAPGSGVTTTEIALVLDVSSSMIEQSRFVPMQDAVNNFIDLLSNSTTGLKNWRMSIVPFSSRVNFGVDRSDLRTAWNGNPVTPTRWTDPYSTYSSSSYSKIAWTDGVNFAMYNGKNYYWMGCVEPRLDFAVHTGGSTTTALGESAPSSALFVPMDDNAQSGKSFCPPPITPLTSSASSLKANVTALTSEGSTRLDAGMIAGWYTLSPNWASSWPSASAPAAYGSARKYVVFMTDGQMNTQDDPTAKAYDWVCEASSTCDAYAYSSMTSVCDAMKAKGVTIFTVSYDPDADSTYIKACASSADNFYTASSTATGDAAVKSVYAKIAASIVGASGVLRLAK
jgi:Flp pilus assembly protein TadG